MKPTLLYTSDTLKSVFFSRYLACSRRFALGHPAGVSPPYHPLVSITRLEDILSYPTVNQQNSPEIGNSVD